jgi:hypothetical protein
MSVKICREKTVYRELSRDFDLNFQKELIKKRKINKSEN